MGPAPGAPVPTEIPALHTGWGLRPPPISTSAAPWGWRAGRGAHFLQIIQQVHVQQVDVLARSDLHRGLFDVVLQLANDLETAPRAQCEPSHLVTLRPAQDGGLFSEEGGSHSPSPAYHMKSRPRAPPQAPPIRAPPHGVPPPPPEAASVCPRLRPQEEPLPLPSRGSAPPAASAAPPWWPRAASAGWPAPAACSPTAARAAAPGGSARCARSRDRRRICAASPAPPGSGSAACAWVLSASPARRHRGGREGPWGGKLVPPSHRLLSVV